MPRWWSRPDGQALLAPLLCFGLAWGAGHLPWVRDLGWQSLDVRTRLRAAWDQPAPDERLVVIGIGERSTHNIEPWPFRRMWHGQFQLLLSHQAPAVLAWDVIFADRVDARGEKWDAESDADFVDGTQWLAESGTAVLTAAVTTPDPTGEDPTATGLTRPLPHVTGDRRRLHGDPELVMPFPELRAVSTFGLVDAPRGAGGVIREMPLVVRVGEQVYPAFALQILLHYWRVDPVDVEVHLGQAIHVPRPDGEVLHIPIDRRGAMLINYRYEKTATLADLGREIPAIEYFDHLVGLHLHHVERDPEARPPPNLTGKIVLVGEFSTDVGPTPRSSHSPLVLVHANIVHNLLTADFARRAPAGWVWALALAAGYAGMLGLGRRSPLALVLWTVAAGLGYAALCLWAWVAHSLWIPFVAPAAGGLALSFLMIARRVWLEQRAREHLRRQFGSYLSPRLLEQMIDGDQLAAIGGERRIVTVLFSDLRDFTSWSESTDEETLIAQLNAYLAAMVECIHAHHGTLHKFIGDAVMAVWGDLDSAGEAEDARRAAHAALAMHVRLTELNTAWGTAGAHTLRMGIGLNTGPVIVGNIGSPERMEFTVIGDTVNLAARLESMTKTLSRTTLIGPATAPHLATLATVEACGEVAIKGKAEPVPVFALTPATPRVS
jgi:adenylate cyclase